MRLARKEGAAVKASGTVHAVPRDTGEGVARVLSLVVRVPHGCADRAYDLRLAGAPRRPGEHTLAGIAPPTPPT